MTHTASAGLIRLLGPFLALVLLPWDAAAARTVVDPDVPVVLEVSAGQGLAGTSVDLRVRVSHSGEPAAGVRVLVERWSTSGWRGHVEGLSQVDGTFVTQPVVSRSVEENRFRATAQGAEAPREVRLGLLASATRLVLSVAGKVVDETSVPLTVRWLTEGGQAVQGEVVLQRRVKKKRWGGWQDFRVLDTGADGRASTTITPRWTHRWRAVARAQPWVRGASSGEVLSRNVPPGKAVKLPKRAPKPRITLSAQRRAVGRGANVKVRTIPASVWRSMKGVSWRKGCPVGRSDLRLVETNYWAFDGYRRRGRVVVAASVVPNFRGAFTDMHASRVPIRSLRLPDRFGRSKRLGGADDVRSMAADNTSVFNCRGVVGQPSRRSPHSWGRSLDLNPWENPFRSGWGTVPNTWWPSRSHRDVAWRSTKHRVVRILARNGFRWTYGHGDLHHFDAVPRRATSARERVLERSYQAALAACEDHSCD